MLPDKEDFENDIFDYLSKNLDFDFKRDRDGEYMLVVTLTNPTGVDKKWTNYMGMGFYE